MFLRTYTPIWLAFFLVTIFVYNFSSAESESADFEFPPKFQPSKDPSIVPAGHLKPFGFQKPPKGPVTEYTEVLHPEEFWKQHVSKNKPAVFRGAISKSPAIFKWTDGYLSEKYGDLDVLIELKKENRSFSARRMELKTFIEHYNREDVYVVTVLPDPMRAEVQIPPCLLCGSFVDFIHETNFWMSSGGTRSLVHFDADHILHCLVAGRKDWMVIHQKYMDNFFMEEKDQYSGSGFSRMNPDEVNLFHFPGVTNVSWHYTTLLPGDCLFLPSEYIHQVRSYVRSISVTMLFTVDPRNNFDPKGCDTTDLTAFTTLDKVPVHWTYNKGDKVIEMGYMNVEMLRESLRDAFTFLNSSVMDEEVFLKFWQKTVRQDEAQANPRDVFRRLIDFQGKGKLSIEDINNIPQKNFKDLARAMDPPHGPEKSGKFTDPQLIPDEADDDDNDDVEVEVDQENVDDKNEGYITVEDEEKRKKEKKENASGAHTEL